MQSITKAMIRHRFEAEFGDDVKIEWMVRGWHVTTSDGDVEIHPKSIKKILGGHRTHRAVVLLMKDAGRKTSAARRSADSASMVAHGEALDIACPADREAVRRRLLESFSSAPSPLSSAAVVYMFFGGSPWLTGRHCQLDPRKVILRAQK